MSDTTIDEILDQTVIIESKMKQKCYLKSYPKAKAHIKSALYELMLSVIGEDEKLFVDNPDPYNDDLAYLNDQYKDAKNHLRADQRNKLKELMK